MRDDATPVVDNAVLHDELENIPSNKSGNRPFFDVLQANLSRRGVMGGAVAGAAATTLFARAAAATGSTRNTGGLVNFDPVTIEEGSRDSTMPVISDDYEYQVLAPWGTSIEPGRTRDWDGNPATRPNSQEAALQVGIGHDGMWLFNDWRRQNTQGLLCVNHEFGTNFHVLGKALPESLEDVRISQHVHGVSVLFVRKRNGHWELAKHSNARRIHVNSRVRFSGPAAGSSLLQNPAGNVPLGTVNNCGSGPTPWGTYLTCEENFNGYFGWQGEYTPTASQDRYGFSMDGFSYGWHFFDKRFDLSDPAFVNESNRFGWVVEIDPRDGTQVPVKRTAMGRFKHENVAIGVAEDGRIAAYMGDDQRFDYCYKYVSDRAWRRARRDGVSPLDEGKLYVARFNDDGTGDWLLLSVDNPALAGHFADQADLLINTRVAADILGATPMDRPEWCTIAEDGTVFWALTNNTQRRVEDQPSPDGLTPEEERTIGVNAANPLAPNPDGHLIRTKDEGDFTGLTFTWDIYLFARDTRGTPGVFTDPDTAVIDPEGRLFIGTDGGQPDGLQDQLTVIDTTEETPEPKRLFVGVASDEITGWTYTPDFRTGFTNMQHPGNGDPTRTNFPAAFDGVTIPRDCTIVITKKNGGVVGS